MSKPVTVLIIVNKVYNSEHFCSGNRIDLMVLENSPSETFVGIVAAQHNNFTFYTLQGHPKAISIDSNSGIITTTAPFDFEKVYCLWLILYLKIKNQTTFQLQINQALISNLKTTSRKVFISLKQSPKECKVHQWTVTFSYISSIRMIMRLNLSLTTTKSKFMKMHRSVN